MEIKLLDLRKLAIDRHTEITFRDHQTGRACKVITNGQVRIPPEGGPIPFTVEDVIQVADEFILDEGKSRAPQVLTREQMAQLLEATYAKPAGAGKGKGQEDEE
jgi:hypothetical protein